jgi:hypothetical protein
VSASGKFGCTAASAALDGEPIHHLDGGRDDAGADDVGHDRAAGVDGVERRQQRLHRFRATHDPHGHAGHDGQRALRSHEQPEQIGPGVSTSPPPRWTSSPSGNTASTPST